MNSVIFQETAKLKKPVPSEKVIELSEKLLEPSSHSKRYPPRLHKTWGTIVFMVSIHILSLVAIQPKFWSLPAVTSLLFFYWVTACLGVTLGYHRLLSHRSFIVPRWLERFFATCGAISCQHGPIDWVGLHRHHHSFSDTEVDHHNSKKGFWWSHMGWMFKDVEALKAVPKLSADLIKDPYYRFLNKYYLASRSNPKIPGSSRWKLNIENINDQQPGLVFCESNSLDELSLIKSSIKNEFLQKGKKIIDRFDDMKNLASNRLEDWLEEDEDINQNLDFKHKSFYNNERTSIPSSEKKEDDPWI